MFEPVIAPLMCVRCENKIDVELDRYDQVSIHTQLTAAMRRFGWPFDDAGEEIICGTCVQELSDEKELKSD